MQASLSTNVALFDSSGFQNHIEKEIEPLKTKRTEKTACVIADRMLL
jgi:hypothetical protein